MLKILLADDNVRNTTIVQDIITSWGDYNVLLAPDGTTALEMARKELPEVILLDVMMPGMSGFEVCRALKEDPSTMDIPIVMLSALGEVENRVHAYNVGCDMFLTKPINHTELKAILEKCLRRKSHEATKESLYELTRFMCSMIVASEVVEVLPEEMLQREVTYCKKIVLGMGLGERSARRLSLAVLVQDWYKYLQKIKKGEALTEEFRKLKMSRWLSPLLEGKARTEAEPEEILEGKIFVVVTRFGRLLLENNNQAKVCLTLLRRSALEGECDVEVVRVLDRIVRAESILQEL